MGSILECGNLDIKEFNEDIVAYSNSAWIPADVDEKIYTYRSVLDPDDPQTRFFTVIKFSSPCFATVCEKDIAKQIQWAIAVPLDEFKKNQDEFRDFAIDLTNSYNTRINSMLDSFGVPPWHKAYSPTPMIPSRSIPETDPDLSELGDASSGGIDSNSINDLGFQPSAVRPLGVVIPLKSNVEPYGPWISSNFSSSAGGIDVSVNPDLAPWVFGSKNILNNVGNNLVEFNRRGLNKAESGSVTVVGIPLSGHGLPKLGDKINNTGPNLTSINFSLGTKGATTTYEFKTYTPKFGKLNKLFIDKIKNFNAQRTRQLRFLRDLQAKQNKLYRKIVARAQREKINPIKSDATKNSMQRVYVGTMEDWYDFGTYASQKSTVGLTTLAKTSIETAYDNYYASKAMMSLDGIFSPVSKAGDGGLPKFISPESLSSSTPEASLPPTLDDNNKLFINNSTYDPLADGHSIDLVGKGTSVSTDGLINSFYSSWDNSKYNADYRFIAMRGPIVLHSWGYDTDGNPVPNNGDQFIDNHLQRPREWPVAPIDLRLDRKRGVWVAPQPYKIISAQMVQALLPYKEAIAIVFDEKSTINGKRILVKDKIGKSIPPGSKIYAYYDTFIEKYISLSSDSAGVMTGVADNKFVPSDDKANITIKFGPILPEGFEFKIEAENTMGYGADAGDYVTVQSYSDGNSTDNIFKYLVIGTGMPKTYP